MTNRNLAAALGVAVGGWVMVAQAQTALIRPAYQYPAPPAATGPASVQLGSTPFFAMPFVGFGVGHDDNVNFAPSNEKSSTLYLLSPGVNIDARDGNKVLQLGYQGQIGRYARSRGDDYDDHTVGAQFDMAMNARNFLRLGVSYVRSHDPRGLTDRPVQGEPDKYRNVTPTFTYALGSPGAQGRVELYAGNSKIDYLNNRDVTAASDREVRNYGGAFYWRAMPKTYVLAEARGTRIRYDRAGSALSGDEERYFGGVSWEPTAATSGTIKVGQLRRRFTSDLPDVSATSWEGAVTWAPRTYSKVDLYSVRTTTEATGLGSVLLSSITGLTWTHGWNSYLTSAVLLRYQKDEYQDFNRTDETKSLGFKVGYRFRRWLTLGAEYTHMERGSTDARFEYDRNFYLLSATASL